MDAKFERAWQTFQARERAMVAQGRENPVDPIEETDAMADTIEWYLGDVLRV